MSATRKYKWTDYKSKNYKPELSLKLRYFNQGQLNCVLSFQELNNSIFSINRYSAKKNVFITNNKIKYIFS